MSRTFILRPFLGLLLAAMLAVFAATPAGAYGKENWQIGFAGTATAPSTGFGFGFWGWCAFGGGVTSGKTGDCQLAQYFHGPAGSGFTCHESIDVSSWDGSGGTFVINSANFTVTPTSLTGPCLSFFPGPGGFPVDTMIPSAPGHYNLTSFFLPPGTVGELQIQVTQIP